MMQRPLDGSKKEAFAERMVGVWNDAFLALMISIGHQTRLYDAMASLPPSTSAQIAAAAGLQERYVREWLGAMVTGRIVDYAPATGTYVLPPEHAAMLTRAAGLENMAQFTQYVAMVGSVEQQVVECFRKGGGVPYSAYPRFQELHAEETGPLFDALLVDAILPLHPGLIERLESGIDVLDVGCGAGHAVNVLAKAFPHSRFAGYDMGEDGIAMATAEASRLGCVNARFAVKDAAALDEPGRYDLITAFNAIHDQMQPGKVLQAIFGALKTGGALLMQDIAASSNLHENLDHALAPTLYTASTMLCMTTSLAYGGEGLGTMWGEHKARELIAEAGFATLRVERLAADGFNNYYIATK
jgi:2-polyprenyl-3-methyl-5-hydroxy-6-metoxy-1,4-benzoquinol methylase